MPALALAGSSVAPSRGFPAPWCAVRSGANRDGEEAWPAEIKVTVMEGVLEHDSFAKVQGLLVERYREGDRSFVTTAP